MVIKKLQNNFTTKEQSKQLLELGLPAKSADCYYNQFSELGFRCEEDYSYNFFDENYMFIPCWSVGRLIEIFELCTYTTFIRWSHKGVYKPLLEDCIAHFEFALNPDTLMYLDFSKLED